MFADDAILDGPSAEGFYFCGVVFTRVDQELQTSSGLSKGPLNHNSLCYEILYHKATKLSGLATKGDM